MRSVLCIIFATLSLAYGHHSRDVSAEGSVIQNGSYFFRSGRYLDSDTYVYIDISSDHENWSPVPVINTKNIPKWVRTTDVMDTNLVLIGNDRGRIYYVARDSKSDRQAISVAFTEYLQSGNLWATLNDPLVINYTQSIVDPQVVSNSNDEVVLLYTGLNDNVVYSSQLSKDGLQIRRFLGEQIKPSMDWESGHISKPYLVEVDEYFYLFYVGNDVCSKDAALGVARSQSIFGPFEKMAAPVASAKDFKDGSALCNLQVQKFVERC